MKSILFIALFFITNTIFAQKPCEYSTSVSDSIGTYKTTPDYMIYEKVFAGNNNYIFYSLNLTDGLPTLTINMIQKSKDFLKANCFDKDSRIYLQLNNGKVVTLIHTNEQSCGSMIRDENGFDNRVISGTFMFMKDNFDDLKNSPVSMMRIKYLTDTEDYVLKKEFVSELNGKTYNPESYFVQYINCVEK